MADQQQIELKLAVWNSVADDAIWRECARAIVDRSPESASGRRPCADRALLILASMAASRVVTAEAGAAPTRVVDASAASAESRARMMRCKRTSRSFGRGQDYPRAACFFPPAAQLSLMLRQSHKAQRHHLAHLDRNLTRTRRYSE